MPIQPIEKLLQGFWPEKLTVAAVFSVAEWLVPSSSYTLLATAAAMIMIDTITGIVAAWVKEEHVSSRGFVRVLGKLVGYSACVLVVSFVVQVIPEANHARGVAVGWVLGIIIVTEGISVLENAAKMGIKLPHVLLKRLKGHLGDMTKQGGSPLDLPSPANPPSPAPTAPDSQSPR